MLAGNGHDVHVIAPDSPRATEIEGVTVRIFDAAKTVADCFKYRNKIGIDVALEALREGWSQKKFRMDDLWRYATIDPGEFFAVVSETFFTRPVELEVAKPDLYDVLRDDDGFIWIAAGDVAGPFHQRREHIGRESVDGNDGRVALWRR